MATIAAIRQWAPHATSEQRKQLAEAVLGLSARVSAIEETMQRLARDEDLDALRSHVGRLNEAVPHAWVLFRTPSLTAPAFIDVFSTAEYARKAADHDYKAAVSWSDPLEAVGQVGSVAEQGHKSQQKRALYRIERRALRGA